MGASRSSCFAIKVSAFCLIFGRQRKGNDGRLLFKTAGGKALMPYTRRSLFLQGKARGAKQEAPLSAQRKRGKALLWRLVGLGKVRMEEGALAVNPHYTRTFLVFTAMKRRAILTANLFGAAKSNERALCAVRCACATFFAVCLYFRIPRTNRRRRFAVARSGVCRNLFCRAAARRCIIIRKQCIKIQQNE